MRSSTKLISIFVQLVCIFCFIINTGADTLNNKKTVFLDISKKQLLVPLRNIQTEYDDNTTKLPSIEYSDSYYAEISDQIVFNELSKSFKSVELLTDTNAIKRIYSTLTIKKDSSNAQKADSLQKIIQEIADHYKAEFVVIPAYCSLKYKTAHQRNWREAKGGSSYERPVSITASAEYLIQFYQKNGVLVRESTGKAQTGKPLMYSFFKKKKIEKNLVSNSRKKYAPPLMRALSKAIGDAVNKLWN